MNTKLGAGVILVDPWARGGSEAGVRAPTGQGEGAPPRAPGLIASRYTGLLQSAAKRTTSNEYICRLEEG
jgi:hypothetical protein